MKNPMTREESLKLRGETQYRLLTLDAPAADVESRTVPASLSSELPVKRWFGNEILSHSNASVNLERVADGKLPMLFGHDTEALIGCAEDFHITNGRLGAKLRFSEHTTRPEVWPQVREGMPLGISIGYRIDEWAESADSDDVIVNRWTLHEVSVVTVPADHTVGINRSMKEQPMSETTAGNTGVQEPAVAAPANIRLVQEKGKQEGVALERARVADIRGLFLLPAFQSDEYIELREMAIDSGMTVEQTRSELLKLAGSGVAPIATTPPQQRENLAAQPGKEYGFQRVTAGKDQKDNFLEGARAAIWLRAGMIKDRTEADKVRFGNEFVSMNLVEIARQSLMRSGVDTRGMDQMQVVGRALSGGNESFMNRASGAGIIGHGTADFANILLDASNKSMMNGWTEAPETWRVWTKTISIPDFKTMNLVNRSNFGDLDVVPEFADYKYGTFSDVKETIALRTYGKLFSISRQAIVNDDLGAFTEIPMLMGRAAARMVGDEVYSVLTTNAALAQDSVALFSIATHANYVTSGAVPSVTTLDTAFAAMAIQTDPSGATLNLTPSYLIVPHALKATANSLATNVYDPAGTAGTLKNNPYNGVLTVVADARLDAFVAAGWYLAANPNLIPTVVVGFLNGVEAPYLEQVNAFTQDGVSFKVRLECRAAAADFRGLYYNDGA